MEPIINGNIWAIGGGKGGVGKSFVATNLACALASKGYKVILVDADLGGADVHTLFGIRYPRYTLNDFLKRRVEKFSDILIPTTLCHLRLICGASNLLELANPKYSQKQKLIRGISSLNTDYILIDIGAGASLNNLDFFNMADIGIIVTSPSPTAMQNAYSFLKVAIQRKLIRMFVDKPEIKERVSSVLEGKEKIKNMLGLIELLQKIDNEASNMLIKTLTKNRYRLLTNMSTEVEGEKVSKALSGVAYQFLRMKLLHLGSIAHDMAVEKSIRRMKPIVLSGNSTITNSIMNIAKRIVAETSSTQKEADHKAEEEAKKHTPDKRLDRHKVQLCLNDDLLYEEVKLHIQTEDLGIKKSQILTIVFSGGRILFSRTLDYKDILKKENPQNAIQEKVLWHHKAIMAGINAGKLRDKILTGGGK